MARQHRLLPAPGPTRSTYRRPLAVRLSSWSATTRQAALVDAARELYARAAERARLAFQQRPPLPGTGRFDVEWAPELRVRLIEDHDTETRHWLHVEGRNFRLTATVGVEATAESGANQLTVVSFVGDDAVAIDSILEALATTA